MIAENMARDKAGFIKKMFRGKVISISSVIAAKFFHSNPHNDMTGKQLNRNQFI